LKRRFFEFIVIPVLFLLTVGTLSFLFFLPRYLEKNILPSLGNKFFTSVSGQVFSIGINEASMGDLTLGDSKNSALRIGSIQADYSLSSIINKRIDHIKINGLTLNLEISEGRIVIPGLDLKKIAAAEKQKKSRSSSAITIDWQPDNFQITNGFINIIYKDQHIYIPFDLQITGKEQPDNTAQNTYQVDLQINPLGEKIAVTGTIDLTNNKAMFTLSADSIDIKSLAFLLEDGQKFLNGGKVGIRSNAEVKLMPFQLVSSKIDCEFESLNLNSGRVTFGTPAGSAESSKPLQLQINGNGLQWDVTANGSIVKPLEASIVLYGQFFPENNSAKGSGNIMITIADQEVELNSDNLPFIIKGNPVIQGDFLVDSTPDAWQAEIKSRGHKNYIEISYDKYFLGVETPSFSIHGNGDADTTQIKLLLALENIHATTPDAEEITLSNTDLLASLSQAKKPLTTSLIGGKFDISITEAKIKKESLTLDGDIAFSGNMKPQTLQDMKFPEITGELLVSNAEAHDQNNNISVKFIKGRIPWQKSMENHEASGEIKVSGITWKMNELGSFEAGIRQKGSMYSVDGRFTHSLPDGLVTTISGKTETVNSQFLADMLLHMDVTPFEQLHLGRFDTSMSQSFITGGLGLDGEIRYGTNGLTGNMAVMMQNGRFENQEKKLAVNNINFTLLMPSLPDISSAPAQKLLFEKASVGDLIFEKGKVIWQLESPDSIFIEEGVVHWVGGRVFTNGVRLSPQTDELVVPIFCDRLILTEVLTQFGITGAEGEGTVSGRIPLHVRGGNIRFEDGFLYSSPGQGGSVKVAAFDLLAAGIPRNTPQFAQIDFAAEALKNFQYNWVRLLLNSEGDDLIMQMQMDGKPVQSLPFIYDSQTGLLQRADETKRGIQQPIRLDVNFRLPLNRFLGYGGKIQDMMKKMQ